MTTILHLYALCAGQINRHLKNSIYLRVPRVIMWLVGASKQDGVEIGFRQGHSNRN